MSETLVAIGSTKAGARSGKPDWLRIRLQTPPEFHEVKKLVDDLNLHTVCQEARCPNIYECWGTHGTATLMILGDTCTRRCGFCAVTSGRPKPGVDRDEPLHVAQAVRKMKLRHAVITSVDRDDLEDGGAGHWRAVVDAIHEHNPETAVEVLTPDFRGVPDALDVVLAAQPAVFSHNVETVPRMYRKARPGSRYDRTLGLLADAARRRDSGEYTGRSASGPTPGRVKTAVMLGIGETPEEVRSTVRDIRDAGVEVLAMGQYLQPTQKHLPVHRWVTPDEFAEHKAFALSLGFTHCESGPLVRSSYHAHEHVGSALREASPASR